MINSFIKFFQEFQEFFCFILGLAIPFIYNIIVHVFKWISNKIYFFTMYKYFLKDNIHNLYIIYNNVNKMNIISLYSEEKDPNGDIYYSFKEPKNNKWEQIAEQNYKIITNLIKEINHLTKKLEEESQKILIDDNTLNTYKKTLLYAVKDIYSNLLEILNNFNINSYSIIHLRKERNPQYNYYEDYYDQPEYIYIEEPIFLSYGQVLTSLSENDLKTGKYIELYAYDILKEDINKIYSQNIKKLLSIKQLNSYRKKRMKELFFYGTFL